VGGKGRVKAVRCVFKEFGILCMLIMRCFDCLNWVWGSGNLSKLLTEHSIFDVVVG
jgi:hypothetical protein